MGEEAGDWESRKLGWGAAQLLVQAKEEMGRKEGRTVGKGGTRAQKSDRLGFKSRIWCFLAMGLEHVTLLFSELQFAHVRNGVNAKVSF